MGFKLPFKWFQLVAATNRSGDNITITQLGLKELSVTGQVLPPRWAGGMASEHLLSMRPFALDATSIEIRIPFHGEEGHDYVIGYARNANDGGDDGFWEDIETIIERPEIGVKVPCNSTHPWWNIPQVSYAEVGLCTSWNSVYDP